MGYGLDEDLGFLADDNDNNKRLESGDLTDHEKMLDWLNMGNSEFNALSGNSQGQYKWQWRKFGRKEYNRKNT